MEARSYELDAYGHLNNAVYVNWLEHGRLCYLRDRGETYASIPERFGVHIVVVRQDVSYQAQVQLGDRLHMVSRIESFGNSSFTFVQTIAYPGGRIAAQARVTMVCVGAEDTSVAIPDGLREILDT